MIKNLINMKHEKQPFIQTYFILKNLKNSMMGDDNNDDNEGK